MVRLLRSNSKKMVFKMVRLLRSNSILKVAVRGRIPIVEASMSSQGRVIRGRSIQLCYLEGLRRHYTQLEDTYERFLGGEFASSIYALGFVTSNSDDCRDTAAAGGASG